MRDRTLKTLRTVAAAFALAISSISVVHAQDVVIVSSGGEWQEAQDKALWAPAAKALGITYAQDTSQSWAEARAQVESGSVTWDIIQISIAEEPLARAAGILEKLDDGVYNRADFVPGSSTDHCVAVSNYSTLIAWNKKTYGDNGPKSMVDFWDVKKFPGKRALWNQPGGMLEAAALALGTPRDAVYEFLSTEEGRKAAVAKLAELAPSVSVWWESGAQAAQLIKDGEVDLILTWGGRVLGAVSDGANFGLTFNDGQLGTDCYAVLKGAPHRDAAMRFLTEMSKAEYQKDLPNYYPTAPANMKAYELGGYPPEKVATMASAPDNVAVQYAVDPEFWAQYGAWASEAYDNVRLAN
ncbi:MULTISPECIES: ABC transporter substrate-binding protein [unclassified Mesorhizobium]|uniref:polyamine ABC transporter substrate-binding protein n=1 Tax=unclassified Mesorhizobium TaxID=325217 RepID=UPI0015E2C3C7|nr:MULTISPECIES: ABC transporter substrate-binding protein [unclassified Mesorhizobium]